MKRTLLVLALLATSCTPCHEEKAHALALEQGAMVVESISCAMVAPSVHSCVVDTDVGQFIFQIEGC